MSISSILKIISGEQTGFVASVVRLALGCLTPLYRFALWFRNRQFDSGSRKAESVSAKVISVGNITTGGTGKTPMVIWICELLQRHQIKVGIVSRGYGAAETGKPNDEALELKSRLTAVPHVQNPDRVAAANRCIKEHSVDTIVLDDGFQHRRLGRDLDIVLIDASNPFGYGRLLPRGLLREPLSALGRADFVVITRCDRVDEDKIEKIRSRIEKETSASIGRTRTTAVALVQFSGKEVNLEELRTGNWFAASAIGNPTSFENSLTDLGCDLCGSHQFRDHHRFDETELFKLAQSAKDSGADRLVCTHKDLVKIERDSIDGLSLYALKIELEFLEGQADLEKLILENGRG